MSETFENGDRVEDGKQGEVVGPATSESHKGKGVWPCASPATRARSNASSQLYSVRGLPDQLVDRTA